jgi:type IV pilus assembly protein PilA
MINLIGDCRSLGERGFTLIELIVVTTVIAITLAVVVPTFKAYQEKSLQTEAKLALASIYTAEAGILSGEGHYSACFGNLGIALPYEGRRYYTTGLENGFNYPSGDRFSRNCTRTSLVSEDESLGALYQAVMTLNGNECMSGDGQTYFSATANVSGVNTGQRNLSESSTMCSDTFQVYSIGDISAALAFDEWSVDHNKKFVNTGLPSVVASNAGMGHAWDKEGLLGGTAGPCVFPRKSYDELADDNPCIPDL